MSDQYLIKHSTKDLYIHYNPHIQQYFVGDKKLGAAVFYRLQGEYFLHSMSMEHNVKEWKLVQINPNPAKTINISRSDEVGIFDALH